MAVSTLNRELRNRLCQELSRKLGLPEEVQGQVLEIVTDYVPQLFLSSDLGAPVLRMCRSYLYDTDQLPDSFEFNGRNGHSITDYQFPRLSAGKRNFAAKARTILEVEANAKLNGYKNSIAELDTAIQALENVCAAVNASNTLVELRSKRLMIEGQAERFIERCPWFAKREPDDEEDDDELIENRPKKKVKLKAEPMQSGKARRSMPEDRDDDDEEDDDEFDEE